MSGGPSPETDPTRVSGSAGLVAGALILDGRFRVVRLLGGGGMGLVYLAEQVSLGRLVAVKVLREDLPLNANMSERFRREALVLSSIEHPAVVRIIDFGQTGTAACIVMEYVEGEPLELVLQREAPLSVERTEHLLVQLAQGLGAIHAKGVIHRDLKPDNVMLTRAVDGQEQARLLDFGIARLAVVEGEKNVTQAGFVLGTPEYVSPEQGLGQPLDARSDLYALGVIAYRALTGRHPFAGPTAQQFVNQHIHEAPVPLLEAAPHLSVFPQLVGLVGACLEKQPRARPQTAQAFLDSLGAKPLLLTASLSQSMRIAEAAPAPAPAPEPGAPGDPRFGLTPSRPFELQPAAAGLSQRRVALGVGAVVVLAALAVAGTVAWNQPERKARRLAAAQRGSEALQIIEEAGEQAQSWSMKMLKAAALHQVGRHDEESSLMSQVPDAIDLEPLAVRSLADDYGHGEAARLRRLLAGLPKGKLLPVLQPIAREDQSWAQWGALRFIDLEYAGQGLPLVELYVRALDSHDCRTRAVAAKRLGELRSADAVAPLRKLKELPKKGREDECGHDAAAAALTKLEKELNP